MQWARVTLSAAIVAVSVIPVPARASEPAAMAPAVTPTLEIYLRDRYPALWQHKAVAIGPGAVFAIGYRAASPENARAMALERCRAKLRWHPRLNLRHRACRIVPRERASGSQAAHPPALAALSIVRVARAGTHRGRLLLLPDCGQRTRAAAGQGWRAAWLDLFAVRGIEIVTPATPPGPCPRQAWQRENRILQRRAVARAAIATLRERGPPQRIFVWGDGEGAATALALGEQTTRSLTAIITTGHGCTYAATASYLVSPRTRLLTLTGAAQAHADTAAARAGARDPAAFCKSAMRALQHNAHVIEGLDRTFPLWRPDVRKPLTRVLRIEPVTLYPAAPDQLNLLGYEALLRFNRTYRLYRNHKVVVLDASGRDHVAAGHTTPEAAEQAALYACNKAPTRETGDGGNGFVTAPGSTCVVFARDDTIVLPQIREPVALQGIVDRHPTDDIDAGATDDTWIGDERAGIPTLAAPIQQR